MFGTLIESRATRHPRTRATVVSVTFHALVIGAAVAATARETLQAADPARAVTITFHKIPEVPPPKPRQVALPDQAVGRAPLQSMPVLDVPVAVPTTIPPVDFGAVPTSVDFGDRGRVVAPGACTVECASAPAELGNGVAAWSQADLIMQLRDAPQPPRYPEALRRAGIEGGVVVKFVVDTTGRVDMASLDIVRSDHEMFAAAVRPTLERLRFNPAISNGRKVPVLAQMPFQFTLK